MINRNEVFFIFWIKKIKRENALRMCKSSAHTQCTHSLCSVLWNSAAQSDNFISCISGNFNL